MRSLLSAGLVLLAGSAFPNEVSFNVAADRVSLSATATPLADVLDQIGRRTGMKIVYDGAPPRTLVSPRVERRTVTEVVLAVLEGLGLGYAMITDATSTRVETLFIVTGQAASPAVRTAAAPGPSTPPPGMPPMDDSEEKRRIEMEDEDEEPRNLQPPPQEPEPARPANPGPNYPVSPFAPQGAPAPMITPPPLVPGTQPSPNPPQRPE